jgi:protein arginine kinase activator
MAKKMRCEGCTRKPVATEVTVKNGEKVEVSYCDQCVGELGIGVKSHAPINELISKVVISQATGGGQQGTQVLACESCGMTFAKFRKSGLLGCSECYVAFESQLGPLIERAHEGGTHHVGKIPGRAGPSYDRQERLAGLRRQLTDAISAEQFERAASLRDQIRAFEDGDSDEATG